MENLSFLIPNSNPVILQEEKKEEKNNSLKDQIVSAIPLADKVIEGKDLYTELKEDKVETVNLAAKEDENNPNNFLIKNSTPVNVTDFEKLQYSFAKSSWIVGNLIHMADAKVKDWLDNNSETNKTYKEHIKDRVRKDKAELDEKYHKFAGGKYDDDTLVKIGEFATIVLDPAYIGLFATPWGRAAMKSYWKFAAFSGVTASLDKVIRDLAHEGEIKPAETAIVGVAATALGPLGKWGLDSLGKLFPKSSAKTLKKVAEVIENKTKQKYGNISNRELNNIREVLVDRQVIKSNKIIEAELNFMKKFKIRTDKFISDEKSLLKEYQRVLDSKLIQKQIKELSKKKDKLGIEALKKRFYPESGTNIIKRLNSTKNKLTDLESKFGKDKAKYILDNQKQFEKVALKIGERNNIILEKLAEKDIALTKYVIKPLLAAGTMPVLGAVGGASIDAVWGDENGMGQGALYGFLAGATIRAVGASKVLNLAQKQKVLGVVWGDTQKLWMQKIRELSSGTLATKLETFGGHTKAFGFSLLENIDNPMAGSSVVRRSYVLQKEWEAANRALVKGYTEAEKLGAVQILRGNKNETLLNNKNIVELADKTKNQLEYFNKLLKDAGIYRELEGVQFGSKGIFKIGKGVKDKSQQALRRKQFRDDIEYYFPREYNREVIAKNQPLFRQTIEMIMKSLGVKEPAKRAAAFIESTRVPDSFKMIDKDLIRTYLTSLDKDGKSKLLTTKFFKTPLSEHYMNERKLNGPYKKVEEVLEKYGFLNNNIEDILNNLGRRSFKSVAFAERFGTHGEFLAPILKGIKDKYQITAIKQNSNIKNTWSNWAKEEAGLVTDSIDAYFGRLGQNKRNKVENGLLGMLSTGSNLAMLNNVFFANLGDFMQGFINSRNTLEWFKAIGRTNWVSAKYDKSLARWMNLHFDSEINKALKKPLIIKDDISVKDISDWMGSGKVGNSFNNAGFYLMGMPWLTSVARRFSFNVGTGDAYSTSRQLFKMITKGKYKINSKPALELRKHLSRLDISVAEALEIGAYKNYKLAIQNKNIAKFLTKAGITTSNRDAIIPQISNRLLFAQTRDPRTRIFAQFLTWAMAKTSQTNKILQRIENGDVRHLVKLIMAIPVYSGIQQVREFTKYGEVRTEWGERWEDKVKVLLEGFRLTGTMGWLPETIAGRVIGPGKRDNPLMWFPAANFVGNLSQAIYANLYGKHQASLKKWDKVLPFPIYRKWLKKFWDDKIIEKQYFKNTLDQGGSYSPLDKVPKYKKKFKLGGEVKALSTEFPSIKENSIQLTKGVNDALKIQKLVNLASLNIKTFNKGGRVGYEHGDEVILPQEKPTEEIIIPKKKPMNKKDIAKVASALVIATGVNADMDKAVANDILPAKKPIVIIEKNYDNLPDLPPVKKKWLTKTAEKVYLTNNNNVIPNDIILAINGGETGWGTSRFWKEGSNNLFNIQSFNDKEKSIPALDSDAKIKVFKTEEDSIKEFLNWVENKDSYAGVREEIKLYNEGEGSKERIIDAIAKTGFAEDDDWSGKIKSILNKRINGKHKKELQKLATTLFTNPGNKKN